MAQNPTHQNRRRPLKKLAITIVAFGLVSACAEIDIDQPPIMVTPKNVSGAVGVDVYAGQRARGNPVPRFRGQDTVAVRTFGSRNGEGYGEIGNASCSLDSGIFAAQFTTPANLVVPDYGPSSPALFVQCSDGERTKSETVNAVNMTAQDRSASAASAGLLGALIIGAVNEARRNNETDDFGYNPIRIELGD